MDMEPGTRETHVAAQPHYTTGMIEAARHLDAIRRRNGPKRRAVGKGEGAKVFRLLLARDDFANSGVGAIVSVEWIRKRIRRVATT